jgi:anti-sigma regulatory factor (Ser/Thr protein kinase)
MTQLSIENNLQNLNKVAGFVETFGEINNLDYKIIFEINLILDELITNIISYGYEDKKLHIIDIELEINGSVINIKIEDDGKVFNPLESQEVDINAALDDRKIGGLGIHIIKQKTDEIHYERSGNKNILKLSKRVKVNGEIKGD